MPIPVEQAIALALERTVPVPEEQTPLSRALGRVLLRDVRAPIDQPPFDRSPLDGYAVRAQDTAEASFDFPVVLHVAETLFAGQTPRRAVGRGQAVRLMTGTALPEGADGVIRQEDTDLGEDRVRIFRGVRPGENCCLRGEEYRAGALLLAEGTRLDAAALAVAAGAGIPRLPVRRRVRATVISTGDELCRPGEPLLPGKVYDSNTVYLEARLEQLGVEAAEAIPAGDDLAGIAAAIERCAGCDVILTTGGVSVGQKDLVEAALRELGAEVVFHGIAMKPGMPTLLAEWKGALILGLSGNPFSAAVPFEMLLRPMLAKMTGDPSLEMRRSQGVAAGDFTKSSPTRRFLRAHVCKKRVSIPTAQANGQMRSMVGCNCLIDVPGGSQAIRQGERVDLWLL